jgi:ORF6N domain
MRKADNKSIIPTTFIDQEINFAGAACVMREADLAKLYGVRTCNLHQAVQRNRARFSEDFNVPTRQERPGKPGTEGGRRFAPYAFTEQGLAMLSGQRALQVNVATMRTLVHLRPDSFEPRKVGGAKLTRSKNDRDAMIASRFCNDLAHADYCRAWGKTHSIPGRARSSDKAR